MWWCWYGQCMRQTCRQLLLHSSEICLLFPAPVLKTCMVLPGNHSLLMSSFSLVTSATFGFHWCLLNFAIFFSLQIWDLLWKEGVFAVIIPSKRRITHHTHLRVWWTQLPKGKIWQAGEVGARHASALCMCEHLCDGNWGLSCAVAVIWSWDQLNK